MANRIGVDIGGTFTDLVLYDDASGEVHVEKVPTTPAAPETGCVDAVRHASKRVAFERCEYFLHGTTVGLNALLERRGATVGLLCTEGFRDALELKRGSRPEAWDLNWISPEPLVPRHLRLPLRERIGSAGDVLHALEPESVKAAVDVFQAHRVTSVAVCLMNAYANPKHEEESERLLREYGFRGEISLSHRLSREYRDYERTSTTVVDAFVRSRMANYLDNVTQGLKALGFKGTCLITRSGGGSMSFSEARERSFETINSGPVAGAQGAAELARALRLGKLITADVGGTSFDTALIINGRPQLLYQGEVAGMPVQAPWVDVRSIGAGGGSLAYVDSGGLLHVGPQSAGARPGPACYGRGGSQPTVTDAAFYLGMLGVGRLASGVTLDRALAEAALQRIAAELKLGLEETAAGIIKIACAHCANAIREITVEHGIDPRELELLAFGGAGPLLATQIARELDITTILVPPYAGNFSAWGLLGSDVVRTTARTQLIAITADGVGQLNELARSLFEELERRGDDQAFLKEAGRELALGMRFAGQEYNLTIAVPWERGSLAWGASELDRAFREEYLKSFGITLDGPVEAIVLRASIRRPLPREIMARPNARAAEGTAALVNHSMYSFAHARRIQGAVTVERSSLQVGARHTGPAVIYEDTTTTFVDCDYTYGVDANGCMRLRREEARYEHTS